MIPPTRHNYNYYFICNVNNTFNLQVLALQRPKNSFTDGGEWIETVLEEPCRERIQKEVFGRDDFHVKEITCLSVQGRTSILLPELTRRAVVVKYVPVHYCVYYCISDHS